MIDLRSDTVTKPSLGMRQAIFDAQVGDDVYGDDATVNALEKKVAAMFGKEAGVFSPTGSLANQLAIRTLVKPGEELLTESFSHIVRAELGAAAAFSGITTRTWEDPNGILRSELPLKLATPNAGPYLVSTTAIAIENTHNFGGGSVQSINEIAKLHDGAKSLGVALHLDGARIWNAHIATGVPLLEYGKYFDTISVCFSKGLGAPVGSMMLSTQERVTMARQWRKRYGAGMRQIGLLAAAADYALDNNIALLQDDHRRATAIANAAHHVAPTVVDPRNVPTNIVVFDLTDLNCTAAELNAQLREAGIAGSALGPKFLRLVTHLDINDTDVERVNTVLPNLLERALIAK
ncbi:MAG: GntG family PLP-dependent aldolase [Actinomycetes bacterium]